MKRDIEGGRSADTWQKTRFTCRIATKLAQSDGYFVISSVVGGQQRSVFVELHHPGRTDPCQGRRVFNLLEQSRRKPESIQFKGVLNPNDACNVGCLVHQTCLDNLAIGCKGDGLLGGGEVSAVRQLV